MRTPLTPIWTGEKVQMSLKDSLLVLLFVIAVILALALYNRATY